MKIRTERFCALATAADWQTWLFKYDVELYKEFITRLRLTRGCGENRQLMEEVLNRIEQLGGLPQLAEFLRINFPHSLVSESPPLRIPGNELDRIFSSGILTYPKRTILFGSVEALPQLLADFVSNKIIYESMATIDRVYVEYLDKGEEHLVQQIPAKNWLLRGTRHG